MFTTLSHWRSTLVRRFTPFCLAGAVLLIANAQVNAQAACRPVHGPISAQTYTDSTCTSPLGLCGRGNFNGGIQGDFIELATSIIPSVDTPTTNVIFATGDITLHAKIGNRQGDLTIKDAFVTHIEGDNEFTDLFSIIGGTGELTGASGVLYARGTSDPVALTDQGTYDGQICLP